MKNTAEYFKEIWLIAVVMALAGLICRATFAQQKKTFVAYSMKVAQTKVEEAVRNGEDFRKNQPDLYYLGGITKPWAVLLDSQSGDWILVGERDLRSSMLTLDDWVMALRARFIHAEQDPGVTIEPRHRDEYLKSGKKDARDYEKMQDVRFFGGIENTHFGHVCYTSDWLMKQISLGLKKLNVEKLNFYELSLEQHRNLGANSSYRIGSRFWFYPIVNRVNVIGDVVLLEKFQMGVFTEILYAEINGKPVEDVGRFEHYPSECFSRSFSENYDAIAEALEELETLRGLTRLAGLAKGLTRVGRKQQMNYYLIDYPVEEIETPREVEVLKVENREARFVMSGGVDLMALAMQIKGGDARAFHRLVMVARPSPHSLIWNYVIELCEGKLSGITLPDGLADPGQIAQLYSQAYFLHRKKRYEAAIECYSKVLQLDPNYAEAYNNRGIAHRLLGQLDAAKSDYRKAIEANANYAAPYNNLGILLLREGKLSEAKELFRNATKISPELPTAHNNLGIILRMEGKLAEASAEYRQAILLNDADAYPHYNLGLCLLLDGKVNEAASEFARAVELDPYSVPRMHFNLGVALFEQGRDREALLAFEKYLDLSAHDVSSNPEHFSAYDFGTTVVSTAVGDEKLIEKRRITQARAYIQALKDKLKISK